MKSFICLCIFALVTANAVQVSYRINSIKFQCFLISYQLNDKALEYLAQVKMADLPESVQLSLKTNKGRAASDAS